MKKQKKSGLSRLLEIAGERKRLLLLSGLTAVVHSVLAMIPYLLIYQILKGLLTDELDTVAITENLVWSFLAVSLSLFMMYGSSMASHVAAFNILYELRCKIATKLGRLPMGYLNNRSSGALKKILSDDIERIEVFIAHGIPDTVKAVSLPLIFIFYLFAIEWKLALVSIVPLLLLIVVLMKMMGTERAKEAMRLYHNSMEDMNSGIVEFVRAMPVMKIFGQSASAFTKYSDTVKRYEMLIQEWPKISAPIWGAMMSFLNNALLPVLAYGIYLYLNRGIDIAVLLLFLILGVGYIRPIFALTALSTQMSMISHGVKRMDELLFEIEEQQFGDLSTPVGHNLKFEKVHFSYNTEIEVLKGVDFEVREGSVTALVGASGSGKTTIGQLVSRFYDVSSGEITLGGLNITRIREDSLMENIGYMFQDSVLFYQSIYDNILMGMDRTKAEVISAAKIARCHEFIERLPNGYDTNYGEKGVHLSGGEQQRIQLARVVLKDAPVLVLDEATAFSDPENEQAIMESFSEIIQNKTVIIIAHRLSTIAEVDQIVVLEDGKVESKGKHEELLGCSKVYEKMWNAHIRANEFDIQ